MRSSLPLLGLATAFATVSNAHTLFTTLFINDENQGDGTCVRMPMDGNTATGPIADPFNNGDVACGRDGDKAVAFTCPAPAGAKLTFTFREYPDASKPGVIDKLHKGPVAVYLRRVSSFSSSPSGGGWFKIWHEGYDDAQGKFATEKLIADKGLLSVNLPPRLPTGNYLVRTELIALHNVTENPVKVHPQFYPGCAQLFIQGDGDGDLNIPADRQASIPGHVSPDEPGLNFDFYNDKGPYTTPGVDIYFPGAGTSPKAKVVVPLSASQGGIPEDCLIKNANWCGYEVESYTDETGCWNAVTACYKQGDVCYKSSPPTGSKNCDAWDRAKCDKIRDSCDAGDFTGPPNKGVKLLEQFLGNSEPPAPRNPGVVAGPSVEIPRPAPSSASANAPVVETTAPEPEPTSTTVSVPEHAESEVAAPTSAADHDTTTTATTTVVATTTVTITGVQHGLTTGTVQGVYVPTSTECARLGRGKRVRGHPRRG
ncbi:hypothetical protein OQA88_12968 [Cercophora sp. LCS_1]